MQQPKKLLSRFWRSTTEGKAQENATPTAVPVNKPSSPAPDAAPRPADMLSYEDIYHAAGILNPASGYGIPKVMEMLNSERIRDLSKDIQRASILMALDAAGTSVDCILQDATRRQQALDSYESAKRKQIEDFEALKAQENAQIEAELERLKAHYADRIQHNQEQIEQEKEVLRNWRMATQHESQRISEVIELCQKPAANAAAASAGGSSSVDKKTAAETVAGRK